MKKIYGHDHREIEDVLKDIKKFHEPIHDKLVPVIKYLRALEREVEALDREVFGLRQTDLFEGTIAGRKNG